MHRAILTMLLAAVSANAAAGWTEVDSDASVTFYIEPASIRRDGNLVKMRELLEYKSARVRDKARYLSSKTESEYDCKEERLRTLSLSLHSGSMAGGRTVYVTSDRGKWRPVPPGGGIEALWKIACGKGHC
jgi:hypothetical protein